ncbi:MAG: hypothetical protein WBB76_07025 [Gaiellaceae bacterium]
MSSLDGYRRHWIALLALFVALGGTTYAATGYPAGIIGAKQLKKSAVTHPKIKDGAVTGVKIAINTITGANVLESSLGQVPSAVHADSATNASKATTATNAANAVNATNATHTGNTDQLGGSLPAGYERRVTSSCVRGAISSTYPGGVNCDSGVTSIQQDPAAGGGFTRGGNELNLIVYCHASGKVEADFRNVTPGAATLNWFYIDGSAVSASGNVVGSGQDQTFPFSGKRLEGQFILATGSGVTTVKLHAYDGGTFCEIRGTVDSAATS